MNRYPSTSISTIVAHIYLYVSKNKIIFHRFNYEANGHDFMSSELNWDSDESKHMYMISEQIYSQNNCIL